MRHFLFFLSLLILSVNLSNAQIHPYGIPFIKNNVKKHAWTPWGDVQIIQSKIPNRSALLGAYYLVTKNLKN